MNVLKKLVISSKPVILLFVALVILAISYHSRAQGVPVEPTGLPTAPVPPRPVPLLVQRWADAWNTADAKGMAALFTTDGIYEDFSFQIKSNGRDGVAQWVAITARSIPNVHLTIIDAFTMGDRMAVKYIFSGTPLAIGPVVSTGKSFSVAALSFFELQGKHIKRVGDFYNLADVLRQVGLPADTWTPLPPTTAATFSITGVTTVSCLTVTATERRVTFSPQYNTLDNQTVTFRVENESLPTTEPGPYTLRLYTDNPTVTLKASLSATAGEQSFAYNWLAACDNQVFPSTLR